jgi:steroid 5-alpha reductase family enzyme
VAIDWQLLGSAFALILVASTLTWALSVVLRDVGIVDSMWSIFFLLAALVYGSSGDATGPRQTVIVTLVAIWALRLAIYLTWRNWGEPEDHRYVEIRRRNQPGFALKSLLIVFWLQAVLAWVISMPLYAAATGVTPLGLLDYVGIALWATGFFFESVGDYQLARFKSDTGNAGRVLDTGLWRYTRHPNYFGDFCVWWGFFLIALSAGGWWTILSPLLMSLLLLKVSGVTLLEKDISDRRPAYARYITRTNAFFPGPPRARAGVAEQGA